MGAGADWVPCWLLPYMVSFRSSGLWRIWGGLLTGVVVTGVHCSDAWFSLCLYESGSVGLVFGSIGSI